MCGSISSTLAGRRSSGGGLVSYRSKIPVVFLDALKRLNLQVYIFALVASGKVLQRAIANPLRGSTGNESLSISQSLTCVATVDFQDGIASRDPGAHRGSNGCDHQLSFNPIPRERQGSTLRRFNNVAMPIMQSCDQAAERIGERDVILVRRRAFESPSGYSLIRVARQQSPSPLHRQPQNNTHSSSDRAKGDISTLPARGHFYFALTNRAASRR